MTTATNPRWVASPRHALAVCICAGVAMLLSACGGGLSERTVQNAYFQWNVNLQSKFNRLSDSERDNLREQSREMRVKECKKYSDSYYICEMKGERLLWQLQKFDGDWQITGFIRR